jgi:hypothetical protein
MVIYEVKALHRDGTAILTPEAHTKLTLVRNCYPFRIFVAAWNSYQGWQYFEVN